MKTIEMAQADDKKARTEALAPVRGVADAMGASHGFVGKLTAAELTRLLEAVGRGAASNEEWATALAALQQPAPQQEEGRDGGPVAGGDAVAECAAAARQLPEERRKELADMTEVVRKARAAPGDVEAARAAARLVVRYVPMAGDEKAWPTFLANALAMAMGACRVSAERALPRPGDDAAALAWLSRVLTAWAVAQPGTPAYKRVEKIVDAQRARVVRLNAASGAAEICDAVDALAASGLNEADWLHVWTLLASHGHRGASLQQADAVATEVWGQVVSTMAHADPLPGVPGLTAGVACRLWRWLALVEAMGVVPARAEGVDATRASLNAPMKETDNVANFLAAWRRRYLLVHPGQQPTVDQLWAVVAPGQRATLEAALAERVAAFAHGRELSTEMAALLATARANPRQLTAERLLQALRADVAVFVRFLDFCADWMRSEQHGATTPAAGGGKPPKEATPPQPVAPSGTAAGGKKGVRWQQDQAGKAKQPQQQQPGQRKEMRCYQCGALGHIARLCDQPARTALVAALREVMAAQPVQPTATTAPTTGGPAQATTTTTAAAASVQTTAPAAPPAGTLTAEEVARMRGMVAEYDQRAGRDFFA